jgi:AmmeMemoRadiSam system protein A
MVPGHLPERVYGHDDRLALLGLARESIASGLRGERLEIRTDEQPARLREYRASFVTLNRAGRLRGCIGSLEARRALAVEVVEMAHAAAFRDPRFPPLAADEFEDLELHISVLGVPQPMRFDSEDDLLAQLRPGVDGLILREGPRSATFLPSVWEQLPEPREFLQRLRIKAGLSASHWSAEIAILRYTAESIP